GTSALGASDGSAAQGTAVMDGATLQLQGGIAITTELATLSGHGFVDPDLGLLGALNNKSGNNTWGNAGNTRINLADDARINSSADTLTIAGNISSAADNALFVGGEGNTTI